MGLSDEEFAILASYADTVIYVDEMDPLEAYKKNIQNLAKKNCTEFFKQVDKRLNQCENEEQKIEIKETTINFLLLALKKIIFEVEHRDEVIFDIIKLIESWR